MVLVLSKRGVVRQCVLEMTDAWQEKMKMLDNITYSEGSRCILFC
jgi:hypothetical protein